MYSRLLESFVKFHELSMDENGFKLAHAFVEKDGGTEVYALAVPPDQAFKLVMLKVAEGCDELVFALDRYAKPGQGIKTQDFLSIYHYRDGWRYGVLEYRYSPRVWTPINWKNPFWNKLMEDEIIHTAQELVFKEDLENAKAKKEP